MNILAFETSSSEGGIALMRDDPVISFDGFYI